MAVAGLGGIGLLHARNVARLPGVRLALLVDQDDGVAAAAATELGVRWSCAYDDALADPGVDAIVIATPTPLHAEMAEQAAAAGKHVFCEKPLSLDLDGGRNAAASAEAAGIALQVGFQRRFDADLVAARARVEAGDLGAIRLLRISHRNRVPPHEGELRSRLGSPFVDMTIHDFDTVRWLAGEVADVHAFDSGEATVVVARLAGGGLCVIDNTRGAAYGFDCAVELMGERRTLRVGWSGGASGLEELTPGGRTIPLCADHLERHGAAYLEELRHFVDCVACGGTPRVGAADSIAALELSLAAERCAG